MNLLARTKEGKKMLLGSDWDGFMELADKAQLEIFKKYIGL